MKKVLIAGLVLVLIIAGFALAHKGSKSTASTGTDYTHVTASQDSSSAVMTNTVKIANFNFSPAVISVKKRTTVTWTNNDGVAHTVTAVSGSGPKSANLNNGATYTYTYTQTGTFAYYCVIHPDMKGTVIVTN